MKVISKHNNQEYNANFKRLKWYIWTKGFNMYCTEKEFTDNFIILL